METEPLMPVFILVSVEVSRKLSAVKTARSTTSESTHLHFQGHALLEPRFRQFFPIRSCSAYASHRSLQSFDLKGTIHALPIVTTTLNGFMKNKRGTYLRNFGWL
jgi:hypothetical protein